MLPNLPGKSSQLSDVSPELIAGTAMGNN